MIESPLAESNTNSGIKVFDHLGCSDFIFPYAWVDILIDRYCFNVNNEQFGDYYHPQEQIDILKFAQAECTLRTGLHRMGAWSSWIDYENCTSEKKKIEQVSYRVEKAIRMGVGTLAMAAIKNGFPCDSAFGNSEDNQLYAYIVDKLNRDIHRWN